MGDGLSTTASIIALAACAAEASKFLFKSIRSTGHIPKDVDQSLAALESLYGTLDRLQRCSARLHPSNRFEPSFVARLTLCLDQLGAWVAKLSKIDGQFSEADTTHLWPKQAKKTWIRLRWLLIDEHELKRFLQTVKSYETEFSLELLTILM